MGDARRTPPATLGVPTATTRRLHRAAHPPPLISEEIDPAPAGFDSWRAMERVPRPMSATSTMSLRLYRPRFGRSSARGVRRAHGPPLGRLCARSALAGRPGDLVSGAGRRFGP